jgi:acyl-CoA thioester hydrolase
VREKAIRFEHEMRHAATGEVCATCELTVVHIDAGTRKARPFPEAVRAAAEAAIREG